MCCQQQGWLSAEWRKTETGREAKFYALTRAGRQQLEKELTQWAGLGKTNVEIAILSGVSENTVKHHMTNIFNKLAVETRAQLVHRLTEYEMKTAPGFGTKIF